MSQNRVAAILAVLAGFAAFHYFPKPWPEISRNELIEEVRSGHVQKITVIDEEVITGVSTTRGEFRSPYKKGENDLIAGLRALGVEVVFETSALGLI